MIKQNEHGSWYNESNHPDDQERVIPVGWVVFYDHGSYYAYEDDSYGGESIPSCRDFKEVLDYIRTGEI